LAVSSPQKSEISDGLCESTVPVNAAGPEADKWLHTALEPTRNKVLAHGTAELYEKRDGDMPSGIKDV